METEELAVSANGPAAETAETGDLSGFVEAAWRLSTWAACVNWDGSENQKDWLDGLRERIELVQDMAQSARVAADAPSPPAAPLWRDISTAPRNKHVVVVSKRFPEPHEAMLYDNGWFTWGANGAFQDDPYLWTDLPAAPTAGEAKADRRQPVIVVWDRNGKFFQNWTADFKNGDGIEHGKRIAGQMQGSWTVTGGDAWNNKGK